MPQTNGATPPAPAAAAPAGPDPNLIIILRLTVGQINQILAVLGEKPLSEVLGTFTAIRSQGDAQVAAMTKQAEEKVKPVEDPPKPQIPEATFPVPLPVGKRSVKRPN